MHGSKQVFIGKQRGISIGGLISALFVAGMLFIFGAKIVPTVVEFRGVKSAIAAAKQAGGSQREIQTSFDKNAEVNAIEAITGKDLIIYKDNGETEIAFAYEKRIPIVANATLLLEYSGTTAKNGVIPNVEPAAK